MNSEDSSVNTYWTNVTALRTPLPSSVNSHTATDQSGGKIWPQWIFWAVALPLAFGTVVLPMILGHVYRTLAQLLYNNRQWRQLFVGFLGIFL